MEHGTKNPRLTGGVLDGNVNTDGYVNQKARSGASQQPGKVTRGPGSNKPRIHLVSSKGKIPAEIVAHALAQRQAAQNAASFVNPKGTNGSQTDPNIRGGHTSMPKGVAGYKVKPSTGLT